MTVLAERAVEFRARRLRGKHINVLLLVAGTWIVLMALVAIFASVIAPHDPLAIDPAASLHPPSWEHLLGTDREGRDELSRLIYGTRTALIGSVGTLLMSITGGIVCGLLGAYWSGWRANVLMRSLEVLMSFPSIILAIIFIATFGVGLFNSMLGLALVYMPITARVVRSQAMIQMREQYVTAARGLGFGPIRVIVRHLLPNVTSQIIVQASITLPYALVDLAALSFLGLGVQPPTADWGSMLADGQQTMLQAWWPIVFPALAIVLVVLAWNLAASELRRTLDPKSA